MFFGLGTTRTKARRHSVKGAPIESLEARRLLSVGALDTTFSFDGKVTSAFGASSGVGTAVAIQGDGKILVAGFAPGPDGTYDFAVARFKTDGTFDNSFGTSGVALVSPTKVLFNRAFAETAFAMGIGPDGKIVVGGTAEDNVVNSQTIWELARLNPNGSPDTTFGDQGYSYANFNNTKNSNLSALTVRSDGSIVAVGNNGPNGVVGVIASNGSFSPSFNSVGYWISPNPPSFFNRVVVQSDGKIVVGGTIEDKRGDDFVLSRLSPSGALDKNFGVDGTVDTDPGPLIGLTDDLRSFGGLAVAGNGDLIAGGTFKSSDGWVIARYRPDGSLSNTFGFSGVTSANFGDPSDLSGLTLQHDGKIVLVGDLATNSSSQPGAAIGRISSTGLFDPTFAGSGYETAGFGAPSQFYAVGLQRDGKIVAAGSNGNQMILARFLGDPPAVKSIAGSVINDTNADGVLDAGEKGVAGRTIYLDANKNGTLDVGEKTATTAADGSYSFTSLAAGTYVVREVLPAAWRRTGPLAFTITLAKGQTVSGKNFLETQDVIITGTVYNDANGNAKRDPTEKGIAGLTVFIDKNKNGKPDTGEPKVTTAADGTYSFKAQPPGSFRVAEVVPTGSRISSPAAGFYDLSLSGAQTASGKDFGNTQLALISGTVYLDRNGNNLFDVDDKVLAGWIVFLDANNNGKLDAGEKSATTDLGGRFSFVVAAGKYVVREVIKSGSGYLFQSPRLGAYSLTLSSGQNASGKNFGDALRE